MRMVDIYREALSKGLTYKEASDEYNVKYTSLWMSGRRAHLPPLVRTITNRRILMYGDMTEKQLLTVHASLTKELSIVEEVIQKLVPSSTGGR
jgi:hypothetical protein